MSRIQPMQTNINQSKYFFQLADVSTMNSGSISTGSITTSSLGAINGSISSLYTDALTASTATISSLSTATAFISSLTSEHISTNTMDAEYINNSTIYSLAVFVDGAELATIGGSTLLLNGLPIATTNNLSSIADWSLEPAISNVNMNGFSLYSTNTISSVNVQAQNGIFQNLMAMNVFSISSYTSTVSSLNMVSNKINTSTITDLANNPGGISLYSGDIYVDTNSAGGGIYLFPTDEVAIANPVGGERYGLATQYIRGVSSIQDVSTINSIPYPPPGTGSTISSFQTLTASQWISTPDLRVSSINGAELNSNTIIISTVQTQTVSSAINNVNLSITSSVQLRPSASFSPNLNIDFGLGSLFTNVAGAALGGFNMIVGATALATGITAVTLARQTKNTTTSTFELVNTTTQLQVSTLGQQVSSVIRYVSSVNPQTPGQEIFVSTIIPAGTPVIRSFSDPMNTISSPASSIIAFGQWVALPAQGIAGDFSTIVCSTLVANERVSTTNIDVANIVSTNGLSCGFAIASALVSTPQLFVSSVNSAPYPPTQQILSTFPGSIYVGDSVLVQNQVSTTNLNVSNITSTNGLSAGFAIASALVSTPQLFVSTIVGDNIAIPQNLNVSTVATNRVSTAIVRANNISTNAISTGTIIRGNTSLTTLSTNLISTLAINGVSTAAFRAVADYSSTILWSSLSTTFNAITSTSISTNANALVQVSYDTNILSLTNSYNNCQFYLTVGSVSSPIANTTLPAGIGHYANGSMNFTTPLSTGIYNVVASMNCANNAAGTVTGSYLSAIGNLRQG